MNQKLIVLDNRSLKGLFTKIRNKDTCRSDFIKYSDRLLRILAEEAFSWLPTMPTEVETPCGHYQGLDLMDARQVCAVSIVRSGDILLDAVKQIEPSVSVGKVLIQRDEESEEKEAKLFYYKFPRNISGMHVILCDPLLATGGSACRAIDTLLMHNVLEKNILFLNVVSAPEGLNVLFSKYPEITVVTGEVDSHLNENKYVVPGIGDFGDRYYNT